MMHRRFLDAQRENTRAKASENGEQRLLLPLEVACSFSFVMRGVGHSIVNRRYCFFPWQDASSMRYQCFIFA